LAASVIYPASMSLRPSSTASDTESAWPCSTAHVTKRRPEKATQSAAAVSPVAAVCGDALSSTWSLRPRVAARWDADNAAAEVEDEDIAPEAAEAEDEELPPPPLLLLLLLLAAARIERRMDALVGEPGVADTAAISAGEMPALAPPAAATAPADAEAVAANALWGTGHSGSEVRGGPRRPAMCSATSSRGAGNAEKPSSAREGCEGCTPDVGDAPGSGEGSGSRSRAARTEPISDATRRNKDDPTPNMVFAAQSGQVLERGGGVLWSKKRDVNAQ